MLQSSMTVTIVTKVQETPDIAVFELADPMGGDLPPFSAGSHIDVTINDDLTRQYSLCNNPEERGRYLIAVLNEPNSRGGSAGMHRLQAGQPLTISEPKNHFGLDAGATSSVLLAGGIGITPILCMAERLAATGADFELHYSARSRDRAAFVERITGSTFAHKVRFHFDDGDEAQRLDIDAALGAPVQGRHIYVCGPSGYIEFVLKAAAGKRFADSAVHREYFKGAETDGVTEGAPFDIKLASSGLVLHVAEEMSVLDVLRDNGVDVPSSCEQGVCGTCIARVLEGVPDHRDYYFTDAEREKNDQFTPCCSRSKTPLLVLDL